MASKPKGERWPADRVERWPLEKLRPFERNARVHSDAQIDQIIASINRFGWTAPIVASEDGTILAGHGRVLAARKLGFADVPVIVGNGWDDLKKREFVLADNKIASNATWDEELLKIELSDLKELGQEVELQLLGFSEKDLADQLAPDASPQLTGLSYAVIIRCADEAEQRGLLGRFEGEGLTCEALIS